MDPLDDKNIALRLSVALVEMLLFSVMLLSGFIYGIYGLFSQIAVLWLKSREVFNNYNKARVEDADPLRRYKELLVWEKLMNACISGRMMAVVMAVIPVVQVLSSCGLILVHSNVSLVQNAFLLFIMIEAIVFVVFLLTAAGVGYKKSIQWLQRQRAGRKWRERVWRKTIASFPPIKIHFGSNFVDPLTPLVVEDFCWDATISLVMLRKKV